MTPDKLLLMDEAFADAYERINFHKIHALMLINNWKWAGSTAVPTVGELQSTVYNLYRSIRDACRDNNRASTGGFKVCCWTWDTSIEVEILFAWESSGSTRSLTKF